MVVAINLSCWGAGRTSALGWTPKPWETPHQCLRTRANTSWHCRSQPYFEQSQWYRVLVPGPDPQVRSLSWPLEQILCVGVVVAISNLFRWAVEPATGQIVTRTITPSLTASKAQQAGAVSWLLPSIWVVWEMLGSCHSVQHENLGKDLTSASSVAQTPASTADLSLNLNSHSAVECWYQVQTHKLVHSGGQGNKYFV